MLSSVSVWRFITINIHTVRTEGNLLQNKSVRTTEYNKHGIILPNFIKSKSAKLNKQMLSPEKQGLLV